MVLAVGVVSAPEEGERLFLEVEGYMQEEKANSVLAVAVLAEIPGCLQVQEGQIHLPTHGLRYYRGEQ